jgi:hypothetical protein
MSSMTSLTGLTSPNAIPFLEDLKLVSDVISSFPSIPTHSPDEFDLWLQSCLVLSSHPSASQSSSTLPADVAYLRSLSGTDRRPSKLYSRRHKSSTRRHFTVFDGGSFHRTAVLRQAMTVADYAIQWSLVEDDSLDSWEDVFWHYEFLARYRRAMRQEILEEAFTRRFDREADEILWRYCGITPWWLS